jgi:hypothetical protein
LQRELSKDGARMVALESAATLSGMTTGKQKRNGQSQGYRERVREKEATGEVITEKFFRCLLRPTGVLPGIPPIPEVRYTVSRAGRAMERVQQRERRWKQRRE